MSDSFSIDNLRFFERNEDFTIVWKHLPHWTQAATLTFITWRLADSLPAAAIAEWQSERDAMLRDFGIDPDSDWKLAVKKLPPDRRGRIRWSLFFAWDLRLDEAAGSCLLKTPEFSQIVLDSLLHFEGDRTVLTDTVIMPNHVHLLAAFRSQEAMFEQCTSWKHFTATKIRRILRSRLPTERPVYGTPVAPPTGSGDALPTGIVLMLFSTAMGLLNHTEWKYQLVDATLKFELPKSGSSPKVTLLQAGRVMPCPRLPE